MGTIQLITLYAMIIGTVGVLILIVRINGSAWIHTGKFMLLGSILWKMIGNVFHR